MTDTIREAAQKVVTALDSPQTTAYMESDAIRLLGDLRAALAVKDNALQCARCDSTGCPSCDPEWAKHHTPAPVNTDGRTHWENCYYEHHDCAVDCVEYQSATIAMLTNERDKALKDISTLEYERDVWASRSKAHEKERDAAREDTKRLDWMDSHPQEGSMRFPDGTFRTVKAWAISAHEKWALRDAIDAAIDARSQS